LNTIRLAEPADVPVLMALGRAFHAEIAEHHLPLDEDKTAATIRLSINQHLGICLMSDEAVCGAFIMQNAAPWYSSGVALWEIIFHIRHGKRSAPGARLLLGAGKAIADDIGLPLFSNPVWGSDLLRKDKLLERAGFRRVGSIYRWG
jgi:hypothetical protein